jgi:hypothetical protein
VRRQSAIIYIFGFGWCFFAVGEKYVGNKILQKKGGMEGMSCMSESMFWGKEKVAAQEKNYVFGGMCTLDFLFFVFWFLCAVVSSTLGFIGFLSLHEMWEYRIGFHFVVGLEEGTYLVVVVY